MALPSVKKEVELVLSSIKAVLVLNEGVGASNISLNRILEAAKLDSSKSLFENFCEHLVSAISKCFAHFSRVRPHLAKVRAHRDFHQTRMEVLPATWRCLTTGMNLPCLEPLHLQAVSREVFEHIMAETLKGIKRADYESEVENVKLLADEENALRYASGYIAMKLFKKVKKLNGKKAASYRECLSHMSIGGEESSFYEYTLQWIKSIDRGGLFHVNDNCFKLFKSIELKTQKLLPKHLKGATDATKDQIIQNIVDDDRVQLDWCYVAVDIADERDADELLKMIVENWVANYSWICTCIQVDRRLQKG